MKDKLKFDLIFIFLIAVVLRLFFLNKIGIWYDDAVSISFAEHSWKEFFLHRDVLKPVFYSILKVWVAFVGDSNVSLRILPVFLGALCPVFLYCLVKDLFDRKAAFLSGFLLSVSVFHINYSQQVKEYSLFVLLVILSFWVLIKIVIKDKRYFFSLFLINTLIIGTHPIGIFIVGAETLCFLFIIKTLSKKKRSELVLVFAGNILEACCVIYGGVIMNIAEMNMTYVEKFNVQSLWETIQAFVYGGPRQIQGGTGVEIKSVFMPIFKVVSLLHIGSLIVGIYFLCKENLIKRVIVFFWLSALPLGMTLCSLFFCDIYVVKYSLVSAAAYYILFVNMIRQTPGFVQHFIVTGVLIVNVFALHAYYRNVMPLEWENAADYVKTFVSQKDMFLFLPSEQLLPFWYYFSKNKNQRLKKVESDIAPHQSDEVCSYEIEGYKVKCFEKQSGEKYIKEHIENFSYLKNRYVAVMSPFWPGNERSCVAVYDFLKKNYVLQEENYFEKIGVRVCFFKENFE